MQIWYLFKVSASELIHFQHRKDANKHVHRSNCFSGVEMLEYKQTTSFHGHLYH